MIVMRTQWTAEVEQFAAQREEVMHASDDELRPIVKEALDAAAFGVADWYDDPIMAAAVLWWETFEYEVGRAPTATEQAEFESVCVKVLERATPADHTPAEDRQVNIITGWLSAYALNSATAAGEGRLEWVTRRDGDVRDIHVPMDGADVPQGGTFDVAGYRLHFPGEPIGPPHVWINCRCVCRRIKEDEMAPTTAAAAPRDEKFQDAHEGVFTDPDGVDDDTGDTDTGENDTGDDPADLGDYADLDSDLLWHGIIAPTGVVSGDRRKFSPGVLRSRDLPLPVKYQRAEDEGHKGAVVVANLTALEERDGMIYAEGTWDASPESDEAISLVANRMLRGLSIALDDATFELENEDGSPFDLDAAGPDDKPIANVTDGRITSATLVAEPAFQEAYIALGPWSDDTMSAAGCVPCAAAELDAFYDSWTSFAIVDKPWDGSASRFTNEQWFRSTILHRSDNIDVKADHSLPILEPNGDMNRQAVHSAAGRISQVKNYTDAQKARARRALIAAYRKLEEDLPPNLAAAAFVSAPGTHDGPGWVTHPRDTQRLRDYWTRGAGAAKIRWGQPGDFNRCRRQLAKYVPNPSYLAGTCSNLHKVAIGLWPGGETAHKGQHSLTAAAPAFTIVASADGFTPMREWFEDPNLDRLTPLTIEGRYVYGHLAGWASCHTGFGVSVGDGEICVRPPNSTSGYAYFHTGQVETDNGPVNVGHITMDTGHAPMSLPGRPAAAHYDNTGTVAADVVVGEDEHGIWFSGALRSDLTEERKKALRAASLSGDWRRLAGAYELVAALAVNVPGFPIPRTAISASGDAGYALVAAGLVVNEPTLDIRREVRAEYALIRAEEARSIARAKAMATVHHMQIERARARIAALK